MRAGAPRIAGIDVARGLAVIGMFVAHTYPRVGDEELIVDGRSAILFAVLAGISLGLMTGGQEPESSPRSSRTVARGGVAIRAAFLFLLGAVLTTLPSQVAVILDYYGIMFALMIPLLYLPRSVLAALAAVLAITAPIAASAADSDQLSGWAGLAAEYLLLGSYPALVWLPFLLVGLLCTRSGLMRPTTQRWMMGGGLLAMVLGYGSTLTSWGFSAAAHSGSTAEIVGSGGFAIALTGALLWVGRFRPVRLTLWPVAAAGSMPLTIYALQVLVLAGCVALTGEAAWVPDYPGFPLMFGLIAAALVFGSAWRGLLGSGPLERLLRFLAGFDRSRATPADPSRPDNQP